MSLTERLALLVDLDAKGAVKGLTSIGETAEKELGKVDTKTANIGKTMSHVGVGMIGVGAVIGGALFKASEAAGQAELAQIKLENSVKNSSKVAKGSADDFEALARAIQSKTAASRIDIIAGESQLIQMGADTEQVKTLTPLIVDLARKKGIDLVAANTAVGKALNGTAGGLTRMGVVVDKTAFQTDHYTAVQQALASSVGGFAEKEGKTFEGSLARLKNELKDVEAGVGKGAVDAFTKLLGPVDKVSQGFTNLSPGVQSTIGEVGAFGAAGLLAVGATATLVGKVISAKDSFSRFTEEMPRAAGGLGLVAKAAAGVAALGIGALVESTLLPESHANAGQLEESLQKLGETGKLTGEIAKLAGGNLKSLRSAIGDVAAPSNANTVIHGIFGSINALAGVTGHHFTTTFDNVKNKIKDLDAGLTSLAAQDPKAAAAALEAIRSKIGAKEFDKLQPLLHGYNSALAETNVTSRTAARGQDVLTTSVSKANLSLKDQATAIGQQQTALRAEFDPIFGAITAQKGLKDAQQAVTDAVKQYGPKSKEASDANDAAVQAALGFRGALLQLQQGIADGSVSLDAGKATLQQWVAQGLITQTQADQTATAIKGIGTEADKLLPDITIQVHADTVQALAKLQELQTLEAQILSNLNPVPVVPAGPGQKALQGIVGNVNGAPAGLLGKAFSGARAGGGQVDAGKTYLVGENGPEPFTPSTSGYITPNSALRAAASRPSFSMSPSKTGDMVIHFAPIVHVGAGQAANGHQLIAEMFTALQKEVRVRGGVEKAFSKS